MDGNKSTVFRDIAIGGSAIVIAVSLFGAVSVGAVTSMLSVHDNSGFSMMGDRGSVRNGDGFGPGGMMGNRGGSGTQRGAQSSTPDAFDCPMVNDGDENGFNGQDGALPYGNGPMMGGGGGSVGPQNGAGPQDGFGPGSGMMGGNRYHNWQDPAPVPSS